MTLAIPFPAIDPTLIAIGPFAIRWYALAYVAAILAGWYFVSRRARQPVAPLTPKDADDFFVWATLGVVLGGRLGYVVFYKAGYYLGHPLEILAVWHGGMSFHGGLLGMILAIVVFARRRRIDVLAFADLVAVITPFGLLLGRIANFINGELYGRVSDVPWAMVFPGGGPLPRHPSQLYEAALEGAVLFAVMLVLFYRTRLRERPGHLTAVFVGGYSLARFAAEFFREPDAHLGFLLAGATMGQLLSLAAALGGFLIWFYARRRRPAAP
ncbi:MAG: prolipoprotein diacylglyceryl transferase [Alphaproteobacteria bacterium]|nr:prolipoprotein diacylglyceryl transferase [Alphaproteobacteria bacterium]